MTIITSTSAIFGKFIDNFLEMLYHPYSRNKARFTTGGNMTINILGAEYEIQVRREHEDACLKNILGYMDPSSRLIVVKNHVDKLADAMDCDNLEIISKDTVRHEIIHAFFRESGLWNEDYGQNETLVDWIALQLPKMVKAMFDAGCLDVPIKPVSTDRGMGVDRPLGQ